MSYFVNIRQAQLTLVMARAATPNYAGETAAGKVESFCLPRANRGKSAFAPKMASSSRSNRRRRREWLFWNIGQNSALRRDSQTGPTLFCGR